MADLMTRLGSALAGRYRLERELGRGGMAVVFLAEDLRHKRPVALKVLKPELAQAIGADRFLQEIAIAAQLAHPHILPLHDSGDADGLLFYVMPFVEGESLRARLDRERQLPIADAVQIIAEVADALSYAHSRGVIHRDIKPDNVLLTAGHAVVSDFGIARAVATAGSERLTETGFAVGTPAYMSPEQATGDAAIDGRSDVYSLGCLGYEMLGGAPPFTGPTAQAILARHTMDPVPRLRTLRQTVPDALEQAINRALAKTPADRFATATQLAAAVHAAVAAPGGRERSGSPVMRRVPVVVAAVLVVGVAAWLVPRVFGGGRAIASLAVLPLENLSGDSSQEYLAAGVHEALIGEIAQVGALRVISRRTMARYADSDKTIPEIARELNVTGVLDASLQRAGDSLRLRVKLIRAVPSERQVWAETYAGNVREVPGMQRDVARMVVHHLGVRLSAAEESRFAHARRVDPETYELYLRGMYFVGKPGIADRRRGLQYLHDAIERDPGDALAYAGLAAGYARLGHDEDASVPDALARSRAAALRAVTLDSTLAEAHAAVALSKVYYERDWQGGAQAFQLALELNPGLAMTHYHYSWYLLLFGDVERAIAEHRRGQELDPLTLQHTADLGQLYVWIGRADDGLRLAQQALAQEPDNPRGLWAAGRAYLAKGMVTEAIAAHERLSAVAPPWRWVLGTTYALVGRAADASRVAAVIEHEPRSAWNAMGLAYIYTALGDRDAAFRWLAHERSHAWVPWVRVDPYFTSLHSDPRFAELLRRFNLPPLA